MGDVIEFLERMGRDAQLRHASEEVLEQAMRDAQMSPRARATLMGGDRAELEALVSAVANVCCVVNAPEQEPEEREAGRRKAGFGVDEKVCCVVFAPEPDGEEKQSHGPKTALTVDDNVCCMIYAPEDGEEKQATSSEAFVGIDNKVCCLIHAPSEGEEESDGAKHQEAA
jgi:hypothetical protein